MEASVPVGNRSRYNVSMRDLQRSTGHVPGDRLIESESAHEVPPAAQTAPASSGGYLGLVAGQRPVFSVEKPLRTTRLVILTLGAFATAAGIALVVLALLASS